MIKDRIIKKERSDSLKIAETFVNSLYLKGPGVPHGKNENFEKREF